MMKIKQLHQPSRTVKSYGEVKMDLFVPPGGKTSNFYVRIYVPPDLREIYGKAEFRKSTKTTDKVLAQARAASFIAAKANEFLAKRHSLKSFGLQAAEPVVLDDFLIRQIASVRLSNLIGYDDDSRSSMEKSDDWDEHDQLISTSIEDLQRIIARRKAAPAYSGFLDQAIEFADVMRYQIDRTDPMLEQFVLAMVKAEKRAFDVMSKRNQGELVELEAGETGPWLLDLLDGWGKEHASHLPSKTRGTYRMRIQHFIDFTKNKAVGSVDKSDIWKWLLHLKDVEKFAKVTVKDGYVPALRSLFEFAVVSGRFNIKESPCVNIQLPKWSKLEDKERSRPRFPFNNTYLNKIFSSAWYSGGRSNSPSGSKAVAPGNARYWLPLISFAHGLRPEEICQMTLLDVGLQAGVFSMNVTDEGDSQGTKNEATKRWIPAHRVLLELGFEQYVEDQRKSQNITEPPPNFFAERGPGEQFVRPTNVGRLFPELSTEFGKQSNAFLKRINEFLKDILGFEPGYTYYSFRHSWEDTVRSVRAQDALDGKAWPNGMYERIGGRAMASVEASEGSSALYGLGIPPDIMKFYLDRVTFEGVKLPLSWKDFCRG